MLRLKEYMATTTWLLPRLNHSSIQLHKIYLKNNVDILQKGFKCLKLGKTIFKCACGEYVHMHVFVGVSSLCVEIRSWLWIYSLPYFYSRQVFSLNLKPTFSATRAGHWVPTHLFPHFHIPALVTGTRLHIQLFLLMLGILYYVCLHSVQQTLYTLGHRLSSER